jgi:hypothetical protein
MRMVSSGAHAAHEEILRIIQVVSLRHGMQRETSSRWTSLQGNAQGWCGTSDQQERLYVKWCARRPVFSQSGRSRPTLWRLGPSPALNAGSESFHPVEDRTRNDVTLLLFRLKSEPMLVRVDLVAEPDYPLSRKVLG